MKPLHLAMPVLAFTLVAQTPLRTVARYRDAALGLEVVQTELLLAPGQPWPQLTAGPGIRQVFLVPPPQATLTASTRKILLDQQEERLDGAVRSLRSSYLLRGALAAYGGTHGGVGPARLDEPAWLEAVAQEAERSTGTPEAREEWLHSVARILDGFALVPRVPLDPPGPLFLEKAPGAADGLHWVVDSHLRAERVPVDPLLLAKAHLKLDLSRARNVPALPDPARPLPFAVLALRVPGARSARLEGAPGAPVWNLEGGKAGGRTLLEQWAHARARAWEQGAGDPSPLVAGFRAIQKRIFFQGREPVPEVPRRPEEGPSLLSLLGGRAAVEETLQLDRGLRGGPGAAAPRVPLASIRGVEVAAHPWREMLGARQPAVPPLALCVPPDRAFLYLPDPAAALHGLAGGGADFLARVSAFGRQGTLDRDLIARALEDLGVAQGLLGTGALTEAAIFLPDLNLLGGTDITVVAELTPVAAMLFGAGEPRAVATPRGEAWRARVGTRAFLSTSRAELDLALALHRAGGQGSLGASDEFRVMLTRLAPGAGTRAYAYLSDPFIRRLVGPAQRLGQMRQAAARADLEAVAAAVELRRLDAPGTPLDLAILGKLGYLDPALDLTGITVEDGGVASRIWGRLERMRPQDPPAEVEAWEAQAYAAFRDSYSQYWSRYFDPIALRLEAKDGAYELDTYILPLLDQSAYQALRRFLKPGPAPALASAPRWIRPQVATLSLPADWANLLGRGDRSMLPVPEELLRALGGEAHLAFLDAAPVIQVGGGSPAGLMGSPERFTGNGRMFLAPLLLGPLTRPVALAIPVRDPAAARAGFQRLLQEPGGAERRGLLRDFQWRVHQESEQRLILSASLMGMLTLRFSVELEDGWLVVCNDTSQPSPLLSGSTPRPASHAALSLRPGDLKLGLPAAWQAAVEGQADRAWADQRWLAPWLASGLPVEAAKARSRRVFGGAPLLSAADLGPGPAPRNLRYGTPWRPLLPPMKAGEDFGLFEGVREVRVDMTFEEEGLRTRVGWTER